MQIRLFLCPLQYGPHQYHHSVADNYALYERKVSQKVEDLYFPQRKVIIQHIMKGNNN